MNPNVVSVWEVEVWVDGDFDFGMTLDTYDEALVKFNQEVENPYMGPEVDWEVKMYEVKKELVFRKSAGDE